MSGINPTGSNGNIRDIAKYAGTGPTEIEKKAAKALAQEAGKVISEVSDSVSKFAKTPEGKAITTGLLMKPFVPVISDIFIFGGASAAAINYIKNNN